HLSRRDRAGARRSSGGRRLRGRRGATRAARRSAKRRRATLSRRGAGPGAHARAAAFLERACGRDEAAAPNRIPRHVASRPERQAPSRRVAARARAMSAARRRDGRFVASRGYRAYVLALLVVVGVVGWVDRNVLAALLQSIKADLALSDTQ